VAEPAAAAQPHALTAHLAEALAASAPVRDLLPPERPSGARHRETLPAAIGLANEAHLLAALALLLARHARRTSVTLGLRPRHAAQPGMVHVIELEVSLALPFAQLVAASARALQSPPVLDVPTAATLPGVLLDLSDADDARSTTVHAELVLRRATPALDGDADRYLGDSLAPLARHLAHLLATTTPATATASGELELCDAAERERVLRGFNSLRLPLPADATLASLITQQLQRLPEAVCAVRNDDALTCAALDAASNRLARLLGDCGVAPGRFVALLEPRGLDFVIALVAIWKAGGAYIPIDPSYPAERVHTMLADSEATVAIVGAAALTHFATALRDSPALRHVVCQSPTAGRSTPAPSITLHGVADLAARDAAPLPVQAHADDPAYMLYTSGSTGRPKGAIVRHDGAVNHLLAQAHALGRETVARFLQSAPSSSDISVWQFAAPLALGGTLVIVDDATDVARVLAEVQRHGLHLIELVPAVLKYLVEFAAALPPAQRALPTLRYVMVTGESAPVALVNAWLALYPQIPLVNAYGPTEAADDIAQAVISAPLPPQRSTVPIGRPLANLDLHVLDEDLRPLPVGVPGEICVAGIGVGNGYWRQPEKTQAAFIPNPFVADPQAAGPTLYRCGDIGRWRDDGTLECWGRIDHQVQLRGQRIELPEIEAVLRQHRAVADVVVQAFHDGQGDGRLVAFVVARSGQAAPAGSAPAPLVDDLRAALGAHLAARLPKAMLPADYVALGALPLNPAGKVDRKALRAPEAAERPYQTPARAPRNALEDLLARLWAQELERPAVGIDDDFFALGGDSLSALAIAVAAREAGWILRSADILALPTVAALAAAARPVHATNTAPATEGLGTLPPAADTPRALRALPPTERASFLDRTPQWVDAQPLTPSQQGLLLHWLLARDKSAYIDQLCFELDGPLDAGAFAAAWQAVVDRQRPLRAAFLRSALAQPVQVTARSARVTLAQVDLGALDAAAQQQAWQAHCTREVEAGIDIAQAPLMRLLLARLGPQRHALAWTHHHLLLDGWSIATVLREVLALYEGAAIPPQVDDEPWRAHLAATDLGPGLRHWQQQLQGVTPWPGWPGPPAAQARPGYGQTDLALSDTESAALAAAAAGHGVTLGTLLQAAFAVALARHVGQADTVFGVVSSGRELPVPRIDSMVGLFVVTQPLHIDARPASDLDAWLTAIQQQAALARAHEAVPLAQAVRCAGLPPAQALFDSLFVLWNFPTLQLPHAAPLQLRATGYRTVPAYGLSLIAVPGPALQLRLVHDRQRLSTDAVADLGSRLLQALQALGSGRDPRGAGTA